MGLVCLPLLSRAVLCWISQHFPLFHSLTSGYLGVEVQYSNCQYVEKFLKSWLWNSRPLWLISTAGVPWQANFTLNWVITACAVFLRISTTSKKLGCLENDDLENDDLKNDDLENNDLENNDLENDDLGKDDLENNDLEKDDLGLARKLLFTFSAVINATWRFLLKFLRRDLKPSWVKMTIHPTT